MTFEETQVIIDNGTPIWALVEVLNNDIAIVQTTVTEAIFTYHGNNPLAGPEWVMKLKLDGVDDYMKVEDTEHDIVRELVKLYKYRQLQGNGAILYDLYRDRYPELYI